MTDNRNVYSRRTGWPQAGGFYLATPPGLPPFCCLPIPLPACNAQAELLHHPHIRSADVMEACRHCRTPDAPRPPATPAQLSRVRIAGLLDEHAFGQPWEKCHGRKTMAEFCEAFHAFTPEAASVWISTRYRTPAEWLQEVEQQGIYHRIRCGQHGPAAWFIPGETFVLFIHRGACHYADGSPRPGIVFAFPATLEYICRGDEPVDRLDRLQARKITPMEIEEIHPLIPTPGTEADRDAPPQPDLADRSAGPGPPPATPRQQAGPDLDR
jgi:hypothetical protein